MTETQVDADVATPTERARERAEGSPMRPDLYRMFYPLNADAQKEWAEIVQLPVEDYVSRLQGRVSLLAPQLPLSWKPGIGTKFRM